jgi:hypothetical protein
MRRTGSVLSLPYIDKLQRANALELAFYPMVALQTALDDGRILGAEENGEPAGYLWHGPIRGGRDVFIYQACIDYDARRRTLGFGMVRALIAKAEATHATGIRLRCASSSDSNEFWRAIGFYCTAVVPGGKSRLRDLNLWRTDLTPSLFRLTVEPSAKVMDRAAYMRSLADGTNILPSRFARKHYARPISGGSVDEEPGSPAQDREA